MELRPPNESRADSFQHVFFSPLRLPLALKLLLLLLRLALTLQCLFSLALVVGLLYSHWFRPARRFFALLRR